MRQLSRLAILLVAPALTFGCGTPAPQRSANAPASTAPAPKPEMLPGMGVHHHPITTSNPDTQAFFDQGVALVFGFNHEEAERSFQRASELDAHAPMPYWGSTPRRSTPKA